MENFIEILNKKLEKEDFFLSIKKVSEILYVSKTTILNKIKAGEIKYIKVGKLYKIPKESIIEYVEKNLLKSS
ncbi:MULTISPECIES: helix-turn-helix domain-containing protein [Fusobacterium]|jgi:hypothetical protein|uniref:Excisionase family DNA binding domain-containing protein n=1 Tax=Fusobacterium vincentii 4_1_13 TaxID=469606 RepID=A0A0M1VUJ1_FUSVC|nr:MULTISPECIES: helix-turn-helix domain-containing protein [Fusobacterium]EEO40260.1 excisionase family DNA binding domain-containing protein [Fusobacterium vincentii 4_1_13]ERT34842.1 hypothetical protein HMPREF1540_02004 [Fusobacterium nucleatum CTI-3]EUB41057.1 DNA binding domain protein, excisionase family [Fusobacterium sp. CM1]